MVRLEEHKHRTEHSPIQKIPAGQKLYIPLSQHLGKICQPQVKPGESVFLGRRIGFAEALVFSPIHSSVSGKVESISDWPHPSLGRCKAIVIENDTKDDLSGRQDPRSEEEVDALSAGELCNVIFEAGVVGMGGASFPTHIKLAPPKPIDTLIVNAAECEPYLTADSRLMIEKAEQIIKGAELVQRCIGAKKVIFGIEDNKPEAIQIFKERTRDTKHGARNLECGIRVLKSEYPQGGERQLIKNVLAKEVPSGKLPFEIGAVVHNVATLYAIYEAVYLNKPLYERVVTVTGSCLTQPANFLVRIGTPIRELIELCAPLKESPAKVIAGGPMMGIAQYSLDVPVIKSTNGIILLTEDESRLEEEEFCIRCGKCVRDCPSGLMPCMISLASKAANWEAAKSYNVLDCIECGSCAYVCPAKRNMVEDMKEAKFMIARSK